MIKWVKNCVDVCRRDDEDSRLEWMRNDKEQMLKEAIALTRETCFDGIMVEEQEETIDMC